MPEQWKMLKRTIISFRDDPGTWTQQEVCTYLARLMDTLEKPKFDEEDYTSKLEAYTDGWNDGRKDLIDSAEDGTLEKRLGNLVKDKKKLLEAFEEIQAICEDITEVIAYSLN